MMINHRSIKNGSHGELKATITVRGKTRSTLWGDEVQWPTITNTLFAPFLREGQAALSSWSAWGFCLVLVQLDAGYWWRWQGCFFWDRWVVVDWWCLVTVDAVADWWFFSDDGGSQQHIEPLVLRAGLSEPKSCLTLPREPIRTDDEESWRGD